LRTTGRRRRRQNAEEGKKGMEGPNAGPEGGNQSKTRKRKGGGTHQNRPANGPGEKRKKKSIET